MPETTTKKITIDPITRLEGHGKIEIFLDGDGNVENAYLQIPELRGFEKFAEGRLVEEMPRITPKICGVCPTAHHMASGKTVDAVYGVEPPPAAKKIRELINSAFMFEDHALHFYFLGGPDFVMGPEAPPAQRNILGVIGVVGNEVARKVISTRARVRAIITELGGRVIHPVCNVPGGVSKGVTKEIQETLIATARDAVEFALFSLDLFGKVVLENQEYVELVTGDVYRHETYYMGLVDDQNRVNFYDGAIRVVTPDGREFARFDTREYLEHIAEHVEPWSYIKFPFLKKVGWHGFTDGTESGVYRVAPLARLNASDGMATPRAQEHYEHLYETLGGKPAHSTLAYHWARLVEMLYAGERLLELASDPEILDPRIRTLPEETPTEVVRGVEAPRGTLIHHYKTDDRGVVREANLLVATVHNSAAIAMSVARAARGVIHNGSIGEGLLNKVEMAFRAYDPCMACATHALGTTPLRVIVRDTAGAVLHELRQK